MLGCGAKPREMLLLRNLSCTKPPRQSRGHKFLDKCLSSRKHAHLAYLLPRLQLVSVVPNVALPCSDWKSFLPGRLAYLLIGAPSLTLPNQSTISLLAIGAPTPIASVSLLAVVQLHPALISATKFAPHSTSPSLAIKLPTLPSPEHCHHKRRIFEPPMQTP
jgi:hypothetical protein